MKLSDLKPGNIVKKLAEKWVVSQITDAAEGKKGEAAAKTYAWLRGRKTAWSAMIGLAAALAYAWDAKETSAALATLSSVLLAAGLADKAVRTDPPLWAEWVVYRFLVAHSANVAAVFTAMAAYVWGGSCEPLNAFGHSLTCATQAGCLGLAAAILVYIGVLDAAMLADAPVPKYYRDKLDRIVKR